MRSRANAYKVAFEQMNISQLALSINNVSSAREEQRLMRVLVSERVMHVKHSPRCMDI
jgi:hypothetical protein